MVVGDQAEVQKQIAAAVVATKTTPAELLRQIQSTPTAPMAKDSIQVRIGGSAKVGSNIAGGVVLMD